MSTNPDLDALFAAVGDEFSAAFKRSAQGLRPDEIGGPREEQLRRFLVEWLPKRFGVTHGYAISVRRGMSQQCDVLLCDALSAPKFIADASTGRMLMPAAATFGMIEVKSTLDRRQLADALKKTESFKALCREAPTDAQKNPLQPYTMIEVDKPAGHHTLAGELLDLAPPEDWHHFQVRAAGSRVRTPAFTFIFAYRNDPSLSLLEIHMALDASPNPPDGVVILDAGVLMACSARTLDAYARLTSAPDGDQYARSLAGSGRGGGYIVEPSDDPGEVLLLFYGFLLDKLVAQSLVPPDPVDLIAAWRRHGRGG